MTRAVGTRLGPYEIVAPLGAGGMGEVYRARDTRLGREVAVKVLPSDVADDPHRLRRFEQEAKAASALNHPNILTLFDFGQHDATSYLVTELLEGETLRQRLAEGPLPPRKAITIATEVARGLAAAHAKGIVHRDLKPENLFLTLDGVVKILDFGLARLTAPLDGAISQASTAPRLTASGTVMGTAGYMSPEQVRGERADARSDLFSLGCVLYEMVSGRRAFARNSLPETMSAILRDDPEPLESTGRIGAVLEGIVRRCLEKRPEERFQSARDLGFALETLTQSDSQPTQATVAPPRGRYSRWLVGGLALATLALATVVVLGVLHRVSAGQPESPTILRLNVDLPAGVQLQPFDPASTGPNLALSPDGKALVMAGESKDRTALYLRRLDRPVASAIPETDGAHAPFLSPDGTWIGFWTDGRIEKIPVAGGEPVVVAEAPDEWGATWGEDGTILFAGSRGLFRVSSDGGPVRQVTTPDATRNEYRHLRPVLLPGEQAALFEVDLIGAGQRTHYVGLLSLRSGKWRRLVDGAASPRFVAPGWLTVDVGGTLEKARFDPTKDVLTGALVPVDLFGEESAAHGQSLSYDVASREGTVVFALAPSTSPERELCWLTTDGKAELAATERRPYWEPSISPDGRRLAVGVQVDSSTSEIWVLDLERELWTRVSSGENDWMPGWSADGRSLFWARGRGRGSEVWDLVEAAADGTGNQRVLASHPHQIGAYAVAPDLSAVLWHDVSGQEWLQQINDRATERPFPSAGRHAVAFTRSFSPDGRWLAYSESTSGRSDVYVTDFPAGRRRDQVSYGGGTDPVWSRDGRKIFYVWGERIFSVSVRTDGGFSVGEPQAVIESPFELGMFDVTPAGERIVTVDWGKRQDQSEPIVCIPELLTAGRP